MSVKDTRQPLVSAPQVLAKPRRPVITFIIALSALGLGLYLGKAGLDLRQQAEQSEQRLSAVSAQVASLQQEQRRLSDEGALRARLLASAQGRLDALDQNFSADQRKQWLLAEVDHYVRLAEQHLLLTRDVQGATALLNVADRLLAVTNDNALLSLRQTIARDRLSLEAASRVDVAGVYLRLNALGERVRGLQLPLAAGGRAQQGRVQVATPPVAEAPAGAMAQAWAKFRSLITVRRYDEPIKPLLSEAERSLIKENLQLELGQAQLALLRGEASIYQASLQSARQRLSRYFQQLPGREYQALLAELDSLLALPVAPAVPDLKASVAALDALQGKLPPQARLAPEAGA